MCVCLFFSECLREDIKYENTEPVWKPSYADGETVRVNCMTGYTGLYKLKCEKGEWKRSIARPCAKRKCSHPGDTPNGDFKLKEGIEYVFGVTVVYTCKKGYEMASRINQRSCRAKGWDNAVPICEVVKCPAISTDGEVTASGNTEEGRYGDVIHFECVSSDKMIDGSSDIRCEETGKWSDVVPKCKVTCETTFGVKSIIPYEKTIFRAGESVEITCSEKHWFYGTKEDSRSFTCKHVNLVTEITCETPYDQNVYRPYYYFSGDKKLGAIKSYRCEFGYRETAAVATCSRDGCTPKPLCAGFYVCLCVCIYIYNLWQPNYRINSRIQYKCHPGFKPEQPVQITCDSQGQCRGIRQCMLQFIDNSPLIPLNVIIQLFNYPINLLYICTIVAQKHRKPPDLGAKRMESPALARHGLSGRTCSSLSGGYLSREGKQYGEQCLPTQTLTLSTSVVESSV
uniref:Sushi domain-containing protein n=1 Tax=Cyprinus carpio TaxID=7962 RepID=A0A8C1TPS5_CYPCA